MAVTKAARAALAAADTEGNTVTIPDQLRASTWTGVKKVLELAGGTYVQGKSAWTFPSAAATVVAKLLADGQVVAARHSEGYVPTPAALAARLAGPEFGAIADLPDGASVLEPSAGEGAIARAIIDAKPNIELYMLEPDDVRREQLHRMPRPDETTTHTINCTLESYIGSRQTYWTDHPLFDAAIMNPPFHVTGQRDVWETHILLAYEMVKPGGRLVAVVPASATSPHRTGTNLVRDLVEHDGSFTPLPLQEFQSAGIQVGVIVLDRPFDEARPAYLHRPYTGDEVPVRVTQPETSWVAALYKPVQVRYDPWHSKDRVFRNAGRCFTCHKPVWAHDDGDDDPRGVLGEHMATALDPRDYDKWGPAVMQCWTCSDNGDERSRALDFALAAHWQNRRDKPAQTPKRTRMSIGARVSQACRELGIPCESPTVDGYLGYVIAGRRMMTQEAADYLFEGGFDAAWGADTVQLRVDRLEESIAAKLAEPEVEYTADGLALVCGFNVNGDNQHGPCDGPLSRVVRTATGTRAPGTVRPPDSAAHACTVHLPAALAPWAGSSGRLAAEPEPVQLALDELFEWAAANAPEPAARRLVARRIPEVGSAVFDADTGEKVAPEGERWFVNLRRAKAEIASMKAGAY